MSALSADFSLSPAIPQPPSGDLVATRDFYAQRLGFEHFRLFEAQGFLIAIRQAVEIHFWLAQSVEAAGQYGSVSSCYVRVQNIRRLHEELIERKAPFRYGLTQQPWGLLEMQVDAPFGNAIRFGEPL